MSTHDFMNENNVHWFMFNNIFKVTILNSVNDYNFRLQLLHSFLSTDQSIGNSWKYN